MHDDLARDEAALQARLSGRSFVAIAGDMGYPNARAALAAYRRAVLRKPIPEQKTIRARERKRFEAMRKAVRGNTALTPAEVEQRMAHIERLSAALG